MRVDARNTQTLKGLELGLRVEVDVADASAGCTARRRPHTCRRYPRFSGIRLCEMSSPTGLLTLVRILGCVRGQVNE